MSASARASRKFPSRSRKKCRTTSANVPAAITPTSTRSARVASRPPLVKLSRSAIIAMAQASSRMSPKKRSVGESTCANTGSTSSPNPVEHHQQSAAAVGPPAPRDQAAGDERAADEPEQGAEAGDRFVGEDDRRERDEFGRDGGRPQRRPEDRPVHRAGEAPQRRRRSGGGASPSPRNWSRPFDAPRPAQPAGDAQRFRRCWLSHRLYSRRTPLCALTKPGSGVSVRFAQLHQAVEPDAHEARNAGDVAGACRPLSEVRPMPYRALALALALLALVPAAASAALDRTKPTVARQPARDRGRAQLGVARLEPVDRQFRHVRLLRQGRRHRRRVLGPADPDDVHLGQPSAQPHLPLRGLRRGPGAEPLGQFQPGVRDDARRPARGGSDEPARGLADPESDRHRVGPVGECRPLRRLALGLERVDHGDDLHGDVAVPGHELHVRRARGQRRLGLVGLERSADDLHARGHDRADDAGQPDRERGLTHAAAHLLAAVDRRLLHRRIQRLRRRQAHRPRAAGRPDRDGPLQPARGHDLRHRGQGVRRVRQLLAGRPTVARDRCRARTRPRRPRRRTSSSAS